MRKAKRTDKTDILSPIEYTRWDNPIVMTAFRIMSELNRWLGDMYGPSNKPLVFLVVSSPVVVLSVGDVCVWDSYSNSQEELTFSFCKDKLEDYAIYMISPFE